MLEVSAVAVTAIRQLLKATPELPEDAGLRIGPDPDAYRVMAYSLTLAPEPHPDDDVVELDGARLFLHRDVVKPLQDKQLDASVTEAGRVDFTFRLVA